MRAASAGFDAIVAKQTAPTTARQTIRIAVSKLRAKRAIKDIAHVARIVQRPGDRCLVVVLNWRLYGGFRRISGPGARTAKASLMTKRVVEVCDGAL